MNSTESHSGFQAITANMHLSSGFIQGVLVKKDPVLLHAEGRPMPALHRTAYSRHNAEQDPKTVEADASNWPPIIISMAPL
jgi:hypothetical protein